MPIEIKQLMLGIAATNAYIVGDTVSGSAVVIDPVDNAPLIYQTAVEAGWKIKMILATHAHFDHILASKQLKEDTGAPFVIHEDCVEWLDNLPGQGRLFGIPEFPEAAKPDQLLSSERTTIKIDEIEFETLYTPGHAPGHISFFMPKERIVFSGDCLFTGSIGRVDLPGASYEVLMMSIFQQLLPLGDDVRVLPGHMGQTTIGRERQTNPYILSFDEDQL